MQTFSKAERLCSKVLIDKLVETGRSFHSFPFKIIWLETQESNVTVPVQLVISVPKRIFKKAVHRNLLKRRTREAYRKNKMIIYEYLNNKKILLMLVYTAKTMLTYAELEKKIIEASGHLIKELNHKKN